MAGPIASYEQHPTDAALTGKKLRTETIVVGSDTVHMPFVTQAWNKKVLGVYRFNLDTRYTVLASAQNGTTAGILFAHLPSATTGKSSRIRRLAISSVHNTAFAGVAAPRIKCTRYTSAGTLSGTLLVADEVDQTGPAPALLLSSANTGNTVVAVSHFGAADVVGSLTAVGGWAPNVIEIIRAGAPEDEWEIFAPGEGFVIWQDVNGSTSDTRLVGVSMLFDEIDTA